MSRNSTPKKSVTDVLRQGAGSSSFVYSPKAVYEFQDETVLQESAPQKENDSRPWYKFGDDNLLPQQIVDAIYKNDVLPSNIETDQNLIVGGGLTYWTKKREATGEIQDFSSIPEVDEFLQGFDHREYMRLRLSNLAHTFNTPTEFVMNDESTPKVVSLKSLDVLDVRSGFQKPSTGEVEKFYICGNWHKPNFTPEDEQKGNVISVPAYNKYSKEQASKFIRWSRYHIPGQKYYSFPSWWFAIKNWLALSVEISKFQLANINNGMNVKFHIKIPASFLSQFTTEDAKTKAKEDIQAQIEQNLLGAANAGKTWSSYTAHVNGQQVEGIEIVPIQYDSKDDTFMKTFEVSTRAISRASYVDPTLAGIDLNGNLGSGSEIRSKYNYHVGVKANGRRDVALEDMYIVSKLNGFPANLEWGFNLVTLVTTDKSATGTEKATS